MDKNESGKVVRNVESNFKQWMAISNLTEKDFLNYRTVADFELMGGSDSGYKIIVMGYKLNGEFIKIGEQFAYQESDLSGFEDLALLLLFMAKKLDDANRKAPKFEQRPEYFFNKVKTFIVGMEDYCRLMK